MTNELDSPIDWPTVEVDGTVFTIQYGLGVQYQVSKAGVDLTAFANSATAFAAAMDLFSIIAKPQLEALNQPALNGEQWAVKVATMGKYTEIAQALGRAFQLSKVAPTASSPIPDTTAQPGKPN
jgi:hypothetical protein